MNQPALFDASKTCPTPCPVGHCAAIRFPSQDKVPTCAHDLDPEHRARPKGCLNTIDPATAPFPEGY